MSENKSLIISDEKFIRKMEENSLNPKKNNCSSFGRKDDFLDIKIKANSAEGNEWARVEIEEEENFIMERKSMEENVEKPKLREVTCKGLVMG